jgi:UDP-N-acetylmuramate dehydrogenase
VSLDGVATVLEARLPDAVTRGVPVAELTTYRLGGPVDVVVRVVDEAGLAVVAAALDRDADASVLVVGRGSNLLVADEGFAGIALVLEGEFERVDLDERGVRVRAGAGVPLPVLARRAAAAGLAGLEFYVGIPGSVGGAVRMNAGGHGRETRDVLRRAWVFDLRDGERTRAEPRDVATLDLGYRHSALSPSEVVTRAEFTVTRDVAEECESRVAEIVRWRREHQPGGSNAGSVFRNPPGDSAGRLIDATGCKGLRIGGAVVSDKHANFFQAEPGATASDVHALVMEVRERVATATGVRLVPELRMVGFGETHADEPETNGHAGRDEPIKEKGP